MNKLISKIRSEDGAANVVEAIIVYPVVFLTVALLLILGFTYVQQGYLNFQSQKISDYLAKAVAYPGYVYIERPGYTTGEEGVSVGDIKKAMQAEKPYRYLFGIFGGQTGIEYDGVPGDTDVAKRYAGFMANTYLHSHGYLKAYAGSLDVPDGFDAEHTAVNAGLGYACAISATTSQIKVYLAQNYVFARLFTMIGLGNKSYTISATGISAVSDSLEIVKTMDFGMDMAALLADKLGFDTNRIKTLKSIIQGDSKK